MFDRYSKHLPIAWLQLSFGRSKMIAAIVGVVVADLLIWTQLGFYSAAMNSTVVIHRRLDGDLVVLTKETNQLVSADTFSRRTMIRMSSHADVASVKCMYLSNAEWRNPWDGQSRPIMVIGIDPENPAAKFDAADLSLISQPDHGLFDIQGREDYGPIVEQFLEGGRTNYELNRRRIYLAGLFNLGAGFTIEGNFLTSTNNFIRIFGDRNPGSINVGVVDVKPGKDLQRVARELQEIAGPNLTVTTRDQLIQNEFAFMRRRTPIGFIFSLGTVVGFFVGFAIVYQILYTDVSNHLPQYATLKAIGYTDGYLFGVVIEESFMLAIMGYIPGTLLSAGVYALARHATQLPMQMTLLRGAGILIATIIMCIGSGFFAVRKLKQADPADVF